MNKYVVIILLLINTQLKAQLPIFDNPNVPIISEQVNMIDSLLDDNFLTEYFEIDSIKITGKLWKNKIETINYFQVSNTKLKILFYKLNDELIFVRIIENSKKYGDLASSITDFYYHEKRTNLIWNYLKRPTGLAMKIDEDTYSIFGYNKYFNEEFLKNYVTVLYEEIKTTHNNDNRCITPKKQK